MLVTLVEHIETLAAWPADWDVDFKRHDPRQTTVQGKVRGGRDRFGSFSGFCHQRNPAPSEGVPHAGIVFCCIGPVWGFGGRLVVP